MSPGPKPYSDIGGGGSYPPHGEDFFNRIVNVHWPKKGGGAVFIYGTVIGNTLYRVLFKNNLDKSPTISTVTLSGEPPLIYDRYASNFSLMGSSYALVKGRPTFLVCGYRVVPHDVDDGIGNMVTVFDYHASIYVSNDGFKWSSVYTRDAIRDAYETIYVLISMALVWNPGAKSFYYDQTYSFTFVHNTTAGRAEEDILSSSDGKSWGSASSQTITNVSPAYVSRFPSYCTHNDCLDGYGQNIPDGNMKFDSKANLLIRPAQPLVYAYSSGFIGYVADQSAEVEIEDRRLETAIATVSIPGASSISCAAAADGILMAAGEGPKPDPASSGPGIVAFSLDRGQTWTILATPPDPVLTMVAAPASDLG